MSQNLTDEEIEARIEALSLEHRDLDDAIEALRQRAFVDQMQLQRMKKRKLLIKDLISQLESMLIPDLPA